MGGIPRPAFGGNGRMVAALTLLALGLRLFRAGSQSVWIDEAETIKYAAVLGSYTWENLVYNLHGALYAALLHVWSQVFGTGEFALRSFSAVLGAATVPALAWALVPLGKPRTRLLACALLAVHPFHIWYSQELRGYALLFPAATLSTGLFLRLRFDRPRGFLAYTAANTAAFLGNLSHLFTLAAHGFSHLLRGRAGRATWRGLLLSWATTLVLLTPWIGVFWQTHMDRPGVLAVGAVPAEERIRGASSAPILGVPYSYYVFSVGYTLGPSLRELQTLNQSIDLAVLQGHVPILALAGLAFGIAAVLGMVRLWKSGPEARVWFWLAILPVVLVYGTALRNLKVFNPRYAAVAFPAYVLAVAEGVTSLGRRRSLLLGLAVFVPTGTSLVQLYADAAYAKDDARSAAAYLRGHVRPGDLVFSVGTDIPLHSYYWPELRSEAGGYEYEGTYFIGPIPWPERLARFDALAGSHDVSWVLFLRDHWEDPEGRFRRHIESNYEVEDREAYPGAEVWKVRREDAS